MGDGRRARYDQIGSAFFARSIGVPRAPVQVVHCDENNKISFLLTAITRPTTENLILVTTLSPSNDDDSPFSIKRIQRRNDKMVAAHREPSTPVQFAVWDEKNDVFASR